MVSGKRPGATDVVEINPMYLFRWEEAQQAHVLLYPEGVVKLNEAAAEILKTCDGARTVDAVIADLSARFDADVRDDVLEFLEVAHAQDWIRVKP
ncbi:MAG TPA: pyrroloquinoline quinone biosynthesis peptide chaperone PqqD [Azospirillum sp.]|nr:pyrroloquinoline quinone biosynthesis peptide chaperone PqqD [Azospirillum sp.]